MNRNCNIFLYLSLLTCLQVLYVMMYLGGLELGLMNLVAKRIQGTNSFHIQACTITIIIVHECITIVSFVKCRFPGNLRE